MIKSLYKQYFKFKKIKKPPTSILTENLTTLELPATMHYFCLECKKPIETKETVEDNTSALQHKLNLVLSCPVCKNHISANTYNNYAALTTSKISIETFIENLFKTLIAQIRSDIELNNKHNWYLLIDKTKSNYIIAPIGDPKKRYTIYTGIY